MFSAIQYNRFEYSTALPQLSSFIFVQLQLDDTEKWARLKSCLVKTDDCNNLSKRYKVTTCSSHLSLDLLCWSCSLCSRSFRWDLIYSPQLYADCKRIQACRPYSHGVGLLPPTSRVRAWMSTSTIHCHHQFITLLWFSGAGTQLWMHPISIWAIIRWAPTSTANCTRTPDLSGATTAILASKPLRSHSLSSEASKPFRDANAAILSSRAGVAQYMKTEWRVVAIFNVILFIILVSPRRRIGHKRLSTTCFFLRCRTDLLTVFSLYVHYIVVSRSCTSLAAVRGDTLEEAMRKVVAGDRNTSRWSAWPSDVELA